MAKREELFPYRNEWKPGLISSGGRALDAEGTDVREPLLLGARRLYRALPGHSVRLALATSLV